MLNFVACCIREEIKFEIREGAIKKKWRQGGARQGASGGKRRNVGHCNGWSDHVII
jgi:hypothetical protein